MNSDTYTKKGEETDPKQAFEDLEGTTKDNQDFEAPTSEKLGGKLQDETFSDCKPSFEDVVPKSAELEELESLKLRIKDLEENILREKAENQNTRKRMAKEIALARDFGVEKFVREFLPMKDSLDMGLANIDSTVEIESVKTGIELTLKMADDFLKKMEITEINPEGQPFDPEEHQAMSVQKSDSEPANIVLKVFQVGYKLKERLIRPAMVVVSAKQN